MDKVKEKAAIIEQYISSYLELHGKSPRIVDIAEATGISRASVSRILNTYLKKNGRVEGDFKGNIMTYVRFQYNGSCCWTNFLRLSSISRREH